MEMLAIVLIVCILLFRRLLRFIYKKKWNQNLTADILFRQQAVTENDLLKLAIQVQNQKRLPLPALSVHCKLPGALREKDYEGKSFFENWEREELFSLFANQTITRTLTFWCRQRGVYEFTDIRLTNHSFFMDAVFESEIQLHKTLTVYPACVNMRQFVQRFQALFGEIIANDFRNEDVFLVRGIRDYQPFDSQKQINWNATAKLGTMMVNQYEYTTNREVVIFLNLESDSYIHNLDIEEESIRLVKTWCQNLEKFGILCDVYTNAVDTKAKRCISVNQKEIQKKYMVEVNEALAQIKTDEIEKTPYFELLDEQIENCRKKYCLFISAYQHKDFQDGLIRLAKQTSHFTWIIPTSGSTDYRPCKELEKHVLGWSVYWRREREGAAVSIQ